MLKTLKKFLSRKFLLTFASLVISLAALFSGMLGDVGSALAVISAFVSPAIYVITEGKIDQKALSMISDAAKEASECVTTPQKK